MNLHDKMCLAINGTKEFIKKHSPEILTGLGISSMLAGTVLTVKATSKAIKKIDKYKSDNNIDDLTAKEIVKITWRDYIAPASLSLTGATCLVGSCVINNKRGAALTAAYALSEQALLTYKNKVVETIGETKEKEIREQISQDNINNNPPKDNQIIITSKGNTLIQETISGRYFKSDLDTIKKAQNELNREMTFQNYISLNQFYTSIGLERTRNGDDLGWNISDGLIDLEFDTCLAGDEPCICLNYNKLPKSNYDSVY